jgi:hypothetical protein
VNGRIAAPRQGIMLVYPMAYVVGPGSRTDTPHGVLIRLFLPWT